MLPSGKTAKSFYMKQSLEDQRDSVDVGSVELRDFSALTSECLTRRSWTVVLQETWLCCAGQQVFTQSDLLQENTGGQTKGDSSHESVPSDKQCTAFKCCSSLTARRSQHVSLWLDHLHQRADFTRRTILIQALSQIYVLVLRCNHDTIQRVKHFLIFVTRNKTENPFQSFQDNLEIICHLDQTTSKGV